MIMNPENLVYILDFVRACLGLISHNIRTIGLELHDNRQFIAHFYIWHESDDTREDLQDILEDFEAMQSETISIKMVVVVNGSDQRDILGQEIVPLFIAKEAT